MKYVNLLLLAAILFLGVVYVSQNPNITVGTIPIKDAYRIVSRAFFPPPPPCTAPLRYSIGDFDPKFGVSREKFLADIALAESVWEKENGKNLFEYATGTKSDFTVNLLYDERQQITEILRQKKSDIGTGQAAYDALKNKIESFQSSYASQKSAYEKLSEELRAEQLAYENDVSRYNSRGGNPKGAYDELERRRVELNAKIDELNSARTALNTLADQINALIVSLNSMAQNVNAQVGSYNQTVTSTGEEFSEGEYISDENGVRINVYQFDTKEKLVRVLAHELGHALGMDHVTDQNAIMYRLNTGIGFSATKDDTEELLRACEAK